jgi:hypothetical protein
MEKDGRTHTLRREELVPRLDFLEPRIAFSATPRGQLNVDAPPVQFRLV